MISDLLRLAPELRTVGGQSFGTIALDVNPAPGETLTIEDPFSTPPVSHALEADTDFAIGASVADTATNLAAALPAILTGSASAGVVSVVSVGSGAETLYPWSSDFGTLTLADRLGPEFGPVPTAISVAEKLVQESVYRTKTTEARLYLAAHFLDLAISGGTGAVSRKKIDKIEIQFQNPGLPSDADLGATKYGRIFLAIKQSVFPPMFAARTVRGPRWP